MTVRPTARDAGSLMLMRVVASGAAVMAIAPAAFAQASAPVTSSVFVHQPYDTGSSAINDNFQYIAHPPLRPVAASTPTAVHGSRRGRRGQADTTGATSATSATGGGANSAAAVPLPTMPAAPSSSTPDPQQ